MREDCGFDEVGIDAVGNVVGVYHGSDRDAPSGCSPAATTTPCATAASTTAGSASWCRWPACASCTAPAGACPSASRWSASPRRKASATRRSSSARARSIGQFDRAWLDQADADGITMREAMQHAGLCIDDIPKLARDPARYLGFVEVHIEQGPVLNELDLPLGVVTSINGSVRYLGEIVGMASHAGTTPMDRRRDAAAAVAELVLYVERRAAARAATRGHGRHAGGAERIDQRGARPLPVQPGPARDHERRRATRCAADVLAELSAICERRGVRCKLEETMRAAAAPSAPAWQRRWERAVDVARPAGAPHAQRRRPRRDEAARGDAAGDAVRARRATRASATTRSNRSPATTCSSRCDAFAAPAASNVAHNERDRRHERHPRQARRLDRRPLRRGGALPAGAGAGADRHAAGQQRAACRAHGRAARRLRLRGREARRARSRGARRRARSRSPT